MDNGRCVNCPLKDSRCSEGIGNPKAKIALVGCNPGRQEAVDGIPFVGPSGQLLNATLAEVGLHREDLWITNAVNCHIPGDEPPTKAMYVACHDRLLTELQEAEIIVSFGTEATASLLGDVGGITSIIGSMHPLANSWVLPSYHPAYIIGGAIDAYDDLEDTLRRARGLAEGNIPKPQPLPVNKIQYLTDPNEISEALWYLDKYGPSILALDTETATLRDPDYEILLIQLSDGINAWVFEASAMDDTSDTFFRSILENKTLIFHNAAFDLQVLYHHWGVWVQHVEDTMMLALCLTEKLNRVGLKRQVNMFLSVPHYEEGIHKYLTSKKSRFSDIPREVLVPYAGYDAIFTYQLYPALSERVKEEGNGNLYSLLVGAQKAFAQMSYDGTNVDLSYVDKLREEYYPIRDGIEMEMQVYAKNMGYNPKDVVKTSKDGLLVVRSPKQLQWFVTRYLGLATTSTDKDFIEKYENVPFVQQLKQFRSIDKMLGTYVDGIADDVWPDGRVHPDFNHGTETGRLTIKNPPLQTLPREGSIEAAGLQSIKKLFTVDPGNVLVHADYSQLELRIAWHITGDEALGAAITSSDFHRVVAAAMFHKSLEAVTKEERVASKFVTFGVMYGREAYSLTFDLHCDVSEAQRYVDAFFARFPVFAKWWKETRDKAVETGLLETQFGRRRRWKLITPDLEKHIRNEAVNFPIQSTASDICLQSLIKLNQELRDREWGRVLFSVHDSIEFNIASERLNDACELIKEVMEHPFESKAVFEVDIEYGPNLGDLRHWSCT